MTVAGAVILVSATGAEAADWTQNLYLRADAGAIFQQDADLSQTGAPTYTASFSPGVRVDLAAGYNLTQSLALEVEPGFTWNSIDSLSGHHLATGESADLYSVPILANLVYKFHATGGWTPYLGAGIGGDVGIFDGMVRNFDYSDTDLTFAYQAQAGVNYALSDHASIGFAYKFLGTTDQSYSLRATPYYTDHLTIGGVYVHGIFVNFTWNF